MSIASIAQDSALRLAPVPSVATRDADVARRSAEVAVRAKVDAAADDEAAISAGAEAGTKSTTQQGTAGSVDSNILAQLVKYVPTEAVTIYIAVDAAMGPVSAPAGAPFHEADFTSRWVLVGVMLAATLLMTLGLGYRAQKDAAPQGTFKTPYFDIVAAGLAFGVWALSLPSTPLRDIEGFDYSNWSPVVILVGTAIISFGAHVFGKNVSWQKFLQE